MYKQSPGGRSNRSRGFKVKHALQICALLALCFWLIYKAKQPREKNTQFEGGKDPVSLQKIVNIKNQVPKLGRKHLPQSDDSNEKHDNEVGDEVLSDDEKEKIENEAQEKLYKADDASSAVTHETEIVTVDEVDANFTSGGKISEEGSDMAKLSKGSSLAVKNIPPSNSLTESNPMTVSEKTVQGRPRFATQDDRWSSITGDEKGSAYGGGERRGEVHQDLIDSDSSFPLEGKDAEIHREGSNREDTVAK
ncbi:hypothetical protein DM860_003768 [Cuscuta australis]|uniref:Uncharacterized protein n=1 Tax=Cuscuta australis TaxID=267555 RepID=A0A328DL44_9ASTE|nr:hypothetical protein DM860_003768 [Cuscuta australis]